MIATGSMRFVIVGAALAILGLAGCQTRRLGGTTAATTGTSISGAGYSGAGGWTTPPPAGSTSVAYASPPASSYQAAPVPASSATNVWSGAYPPPPPPPGGSTVITGPCAPPPCPPPCPPTTYAEPVAAPAAARAWSGCGLPCQDGVSQWHVRGAIGEAFAFGDDAPKECIYWGGDIGRTFCGCWGIDAFYRYHAGDYDRNNPNNPAEPTKDGGLINHVGVKLTYEHSFGASRFYWFAGIGPEYWWSERYIDNDHGFGGFGEIGVGYVLSENFRVRVGLNVHAIDSAVTRKNPADDGNSRFLWIVAPVAEVEIDF